MCSVPDVLLAYQPVGPNVKRLVQLVKKFPSTRFSALVDDEGAVQALSRGTSEGGVTLDVFLDLDCGMHRTGIAPGPEAVALYRLITRSPGLRAAGLHVYDGHIRDTDHRATRRCLRRGVCSARVRSQAVGRFRSGCSVDRRGRHANISNPCQAFGRAVQPRYQRVLGSGLRDAVAGSRFSPGRPRADSRDQQALSAHSLPGSRAQGHRLGKTTSSSGPFRPARCASNRSQRGTFDDRDRARRRLSSRIDVLRHPVAHLSNGRVASGSGGDQEWPCGREMAGRGEGAHDHGVKGYRVQVRVPGTG